MKNSTQLSRISMLFFVLVFSTNIFSQTTIVSYNFDSNIQGWSNNGDDSGRSTNTYFCTTAGTIFTKDDETTKNRITSPAINLSSYSSVDFRFCHKASNMQNGEGFKLEYSSNNGTSWTLVKQFRRGTDFTSIGSGISNSFSVNINTSTLPTQARFRFESTADGDGEYSYFDDIKIISHSTIDTFGPDGEWKYLDNGIDQGTAWRANGFDDASWATGNAELGFGDGDENTVIADVNQITTYFRKTFTVTAVEAAKTELILNAKRDDGMVVYVNGVEVWRDYMPAGTITYSSLATTYVPDDGNDWQTITIPNVLVAGTNVIAVEIHQNNATSSDVSFNFDISLRNATVDSFGPDGAWKYLDDGSNQGTAWRASGFNDSSWATGNAQLGYGDGDTVTTVSFGGDPNNKHITTYFRKTFDVTAEEAAMNKLILHALRDDGLVVYLNGTEIWRDNMPVGTILYNTTTANAVDDGDTWLTTTIANSLVAGTNVIAAEVHQTTITSSDLVFNFDIELDDTIIAEKGAWYYKDNGSNQGTAWQTADVTPSGANWASGNAILGYGTIDGATVTTTVSYGPDSNNKYPTTYFRKTFNVTASQAANSTLNMSAIRDDGMVVYINGTEVWRNGMPTTFDYLTYANVTISGTDESAWITNRIPNILLSGTNEIAVEIHQTNASSSDLSFDFKMYTDNKYIFIPPTQPDNDGDGVADYKDTDDDNDGITDLVEGCHSGQLEDLNSVPDGAGVNESILANFPITKTLDDGNQITYTKSGTFNDIESYNAGDHGWSIRTEGPNTAGTLTLEFNTAVDNLSFRLVDFDENETWTVNAYDHTNALIDLTTDADVYYLGTYIQQTGNSFTDSTDGLDVNHDGEDINSDIYGTAYFYFPTLKIKRIEFVIDQPDGSSIRLAAIQYCDLDTDGDTIEDYHDLDSDNDGIPDLVEAGGTDINGFGTVNNTTDTDGDGLVDDYDFDSANYNFGEISKLAAKYDFDGDGKINSIDLDSDNDGILDIIELGSIDANADGKIDGFLDSDLNGYHDAYEGATSRLITGADTDADGLPNSYPIANADNSGFPNFLDLDSDDDGITDNTEAQATSSFITYVTTDSDGDGILNIFDNTTGFSGNGLIPIDTDYDCIPDYLDKNSDEDTEDDSIEGHDTNGDGIINGSDSPNAGTGKYIGVDADGDGIDDGFDNNTSLFNPTNTNLQPTSHPNFDGLYDRDWRASNNPIDFDGINDFIDFGNKNNLTGSFSLEAWILQEATSGSQATIISKRDAKSGNERGYHLVINSSNRLNLTWYNIAGTKMIDITSSHAISNNKWYHVAATFNGTVAKLYIDGVELASGNPSAPPVSGPEKFMIGAMYDSDNPCTDGTKYFNGFIDEVRIWNVPLSAQQIHEMMNQEIQVSGASVRGTVIPKNISGSLTWNSLKAYYPMRNGLATDHSSSNNYGFPKNITTIEAQTAPLPYTTTRNGDWNNNTAATPWLYGNSVWNLPNSFGLDGTTPINWNIVKTDHDVFIDTNTDLGRERFVLGLLLNANTLTVRGVTNKTTSTFTGNALNVSSYLELNGKLDLEGESQLIQPLNSDLVVGASGLLEKDQQGVKDLFTYNYWCSPVGFTDAGTNNYSYTLNNNIFKDGTISASPANISFIGGYNGTSGTPIGIAHYWIWKFGNLTSGDYSAWQHVRNTGTIKAGEGFTMKGVANTLGDLSLEQNFVFLGKPNNGDILTLTLNAGNDYLVGNPYASALDADQFIMDNGPLIDGNGADPLISGTIYFWEHWGGGSHVTAEYQGGYGTYNLSGGVSAAAWGSPDPDVAQVGTGTKTPGRYIPVGQGFFVTGETTGIINFNNGQRRFVKEGSASSLFIRQGQRTEEELADTRMKIRIGFNSVNTIHRQLLVTEDTRASLSYDWGFDGLLYQNQMDDMYWLLEDEKYTIQGINDINESTVLPIGIHTSDPGLNNITIDVLENVPDNLDIYVHDKELEIYHDLRTGKYQIYLEVGTYLDRFEITFTNQVLGVEENEMANSLQVSYVNENESIMIQNPELLTIKSVEMFNIIGQSILTIDDIETEVSTEIKTNKLSVGTYIIKLKTDLGVINKKVLVN